MVDTEYEKKASVVWTSTNAVRNLGAADYEEKGRYMWSTGPMCVAVCWNPGITANAGGVCLAVNVRLNKPKIRESKESKFRRKN